MLFPSYQKRATLVYQTMLEDSKTRLKTFCLVQQGTLSLCRSSTLKEALLLPNKVLYTIQKMA
tara:strand:+ start:570 stop:758 length:189 start_codon:yes stop_codon:yes gene_type:complete